MKEKTLVVFILLLPAAAAAQSAIASWEAVTQDINGQPEQLRGYHVAWGTAPGGPYPNGQSTGVVTQLQIDNLQNGVRYYFVVKAIDQAGNESAWSNEAEYLVPEEECHNGVDDDHDGLTDCEDTECGYQQEVCDGIDNDCDGSTDEGCPCTQGQTRTCSRNVGECTEGVEVCDANGQWGPCSGKLPSDEICDGKDNDCDNNIDEAGVCGTDGGTDAGQDAGADAGQDGGADAGADPGAGGDELTIKGGCSCSAAERSSGRLWLLVLFSAAAFWLRKALRPRA